MPVVMVLVVLGSCDCFCRASVIVVELQGISRRKQGIHDDESRETLRRHGGDRQPRGPRRGAISVSATVYPQQSYPQQAYPQYQQQYPGYPGQAYGYAAGLQPGLCLQNSLGAIIDQLLGNRYNVTDRQAVSSARARPWPRRRASIAATASPMATLRLQPGLESAATAGDARHRDHRRAAPLQRAARSGIDQPRRSMPATYG